MNRFLSTFAAILICIGSQAQDSLKFWNEGPLTESDFRKAESWEEGNSFGSITWMTTKHKAVIDGIHYSWPEIHAVLDRSHSYLREGCDTEKEIRLQQAVFDTQEAFAGKYFNELIRTGDDSGKSGMKFWMSGCRQAVDSILTYPDGPRYTPDSYPFDITTVNPTPKRTFTVGIGVINKFPIGALRKHNTYILASALTARYDFGKHSIEGEADFDRFSAQKNNPHGLPSTQYDAVQLKYGYSPLDSGRLRLTLQAGGGFGSCYVFDYIYVGKEERNDIYPHSFKREGPILSEGILAEYRILSDVTLGRSKPARTDIKLFLSANSDQMISRRFRGNSIFDFSGIDEEILALTGAGDYGPADGTILANINITAGIAITMGSVRQ